MRILVTGGAGFLGRALVPALAVRGDEVVVADLVAFPAPSVRCVVGDLRDPAVVDRATAWRPEAVVHLAALTSVVESTRRPAEVFETNVVATQLLLERCRLLDVESFLLASTNAVVGDASKGAINERSPLAPLTPYGATKAAAEMMVSAYASSYGLAGASLRFTNIYGPGMTTKDSVVVRLMRAALSGGTLRIYGDGGQRRDYVFVGDAVRAVSAALGQRVRGPLTVGSGHSVSVNELHRLASAATGVAIGSETVERPPGEMDSVVVDTARAAAIGFRASVSLPEGLVATWKDFCAVAGGPGPTRP